MTAVTESGRKEITSVPGLEVVYLTTVATGYTFNSKFGKAKAAFFCCTTAVACGADVTAGTGVVTITVASGTVAGYLMVWGQ